MFNKVDYYPKNSLVWLFSFIHLSIYIILFMGMFIIPQNNRYIYIYISLFLGVHWIFLKGECLISYIEKKIENPTYKMGDDIQLSYAPCILHIMLGRSISRRSLDDMRKELLKLLLLFYLFILADQLLVYNLFKISYNFNIILFIICTYLGINLI